MATAKKTKRELTRLTVLERKLREKVEIKTILASSCLSDHSNIIIHVQSVFIHNQLANPEISCIRMGSGPAIFGLARFYCI